MILNNNHPQESGNQLGENASQPIEFVETIIVGAGFAGLCLAYYLQSASYKSYLILESRNETGGQLQSYDYKFIYDIPTIKKITAKELRENLHRSINSDNIRFQCCLIDVTVDKRGERVIIYQESSSSIKKYIKCKFLVIACGKGAMKPLSIEHPIIPQLEKERRVFYSINDYFNIKNKIIAVFGGGDSAMDFIEHVWEDVEKIYLLHRRNIFTAMPAKVAVVRNLSNCEIITNYQLIDLKLATAVSIDLLDKVTNNNIHIEVDYIFVFYGFYEDNLVLSKLISERKIAVNKSDMSCFNSNLIDFAIGDIATYAGKRFLLSNYMSEAELIAKSILEKTPNF